MPQKRTMLIAGGAMAVIAIVVVIGMAQRGNDGATASPSPTVCANEKPALVISKFTRPEPYPMTIDRDAAYVAEVATSCGDLHISLDPKNAPIASNNFRELIADRWYNGTAFFDPPAGTIRAGDPSGGKNSGPGYTIDDEPAKGPYADGDVLLWREEPDTGGAQFVIVTDAAVAGEALPSGLTRLGRLDDDGSFAVAQKIAAVAPGGGERVWILGSRVKQIPD